MSKIYKSQAEFQRVLGVGKASMSRYVHRDDWPIRRKPPWTETDVKTAVAWRDGWLQENRDWTRGAGEALPGAAAPGGNSPQESDGELREIKIKWTDLVDDDCPLHVGDWIGAPLFSQLTTADLESMAGYLSAAFTAIEADCLDDAQGESLLNNVMLLWLSRRFSGVTGWWRKLPDTPAMPPPAKYLNEKPLEHRRQKAVKVPA